MNEPQKSVPRKRIPSASRIHKIVYSVAMVVGVAVLTLEVFGIAGVILIFGTTYATFGVWLCVRIVNRRERWAKWTLAVLMGLNIAYPLSVGPVIWIFRHGWLPEWAASPVVSILYYPLGFLQLNPPLSNLFESYMQLWY